MGIATAKENSYDDLSNPRESDGDEAVCHECRVSRLIRLV